MSLNVKTTNKAEDVADFVIASVLSQLKLGKRVLLFLTGGSSIAVGLKISEFLKNEPEKDLIKNLTITLTDERYVPIDHFNSNFFQLKEKGFDVPEAKIFPILSDDDLNITTEKFNSFLEEQLKSTDYKIGLFGIGADGHTAGILPNSPAINSSKLVCNYNTPIFSRITITSVMIEKLDEAVVFMQGKEKWEVLENLQKDIGVDLMPAQILKKVPLLTIFSDLKS